MSGVREQAYAALRASAPRPAPAEDVAEAFAGRFRAQNGRCERLGSLAELPAWIETRFAPADGSALPVAIAADAALDALPWQRCPRLLRKASDARPQTSLAVTTAFAAVAETGALAVYPRAGTPMAINFLPERLVIVVRRADVVATLEDFWQRTRMHFGPKLPRGLCLVAGPSSSADIEMTFATGVHGPVEVHALVV